MVGPLLAHHFRSRRLSEWPRWVADLLEVKTPSSVAFKGQASPTGGSNIKIILSLLDRTIQVPGDIAECGVFKGNSLVALAIYLREKESNKKIYGLDSFQGFDESVNTDIELGGAENSEKRLHGFSGTSYPHVSAKVRRFGLTDVISLRPGYFSETLDKLPGSRYSFVHLDCDIYESYRQCLTYFYSRMSPGGVILLDEYNDPPWPGCNLAVDEFLADKPEKPVLIEMDNYQKYYITKSAPST